MLAWLKNKGDQAHAQLAAEVSKYKNRTFMVAVVEACAWLSAADGEIKPEEKQKMAGFLQRSEELKHFDMKEVIKVFNGAVENIEFDLEVGKAEILKSIGKIKGNDEQARLLVRVVCALGASDGDFDANEQAVVRQICRELGLDPADFDL